MTSRLIRLDLADGRESLLDATASIVDIRTAIEAGGAGALDAEILHRVRVVGISPDDEITGSWSLHECLDGHVSVDGIDYLLSSGKYAVVRRDFVDTVDAHVGTIEPSDIVLPVSRAAEGKEITEGDYNILAANSSASFLLMDKRNVITAGKTSPIEVCDLLTLDRQLVHVKRKFSSATLSHLFSQGETSGVLLVDSPEFRAAARGRMPPGSDHFARLLSDDSFRAGNFEIVYAIIGAWGGGGLVERLPFFSKVNLWHRSRQLRRIGYRVTYSAIEIAE